MGRQHDVLGRTGAVLNTICIPAVIRNQNNYIWIVKSKKMYPLFFSDAAHNFLQRPDLPLLPQHRKSPGLHIMAAIFPLIALCIFPTQPLMPDPYYNI